MTVFQNKKVEAVFRQYPVVMRNKLMRLRKLVLETAAEIEGIDKIEETLKWGEPSYLVKCGSTIRMGWKESNPHEYALYFNCKTKLADTFKELYKNKLNIEGNRAIIFGENEDLPIKEIRHCIMLALTYHKVKHLPMLGA